MKGLKSTFITDVKSEDSLNGRSKKCLNQVDKTKEP